MEGDVTSWNDIPICEVFEIGFSSAGNYHCVAIAYKFERYKFSILDSNSAKWGRHYVYLHDALTHTAIITLHGQYDVDEFEDLRL